MILSVVAAMAFATVNVYAQEPEVAATEQVAEEAVEAEATEEAAELGETESSYYIIDDKAAAINDGYRYDLTFGYDFDKVMSK